MASMIKQKLLQATGRSASPSPISSTSTSPATSVTALNVNSDHPRGSHDQTRTTPEPTTEAEKLAQRYLLTLSAGPSYSPSSHAPVVVNGSPSQSLKFENEWMTGFIRVRIRSYTGLPRSSAQSSEYFNHPTRSKEQYSISFNFVPKVDLDADTAIWGNDFDHPVRDRLPPGFNLAVNLVKNFVDPTIELDAYADKPWMFAPALACFFAFWIGEKKASWEEWSDEEMRDSTDEPVLEGGEGSGAELRSELGLPNDANARRKHLRTGPHRESFAKFEAGRLYKADFFNPYIDFSSFSLKLPGGFSLNCLKYIGDKTHKLRYVFKDSKDPEKVYFTVVFTLLHGEDLSEALQKLERGEDVVAAVVED